MSELDARVESLRARGVEVVDPRQTYVGAEVDLDRIHPGSVLHPGVRLQGARTLLAPGAEVGTEGPVTVRDAVLGTGASVASGFVHGAVLLDGASLGGSCHVRQGTLLEEQASTAHAVGLKHTILLSFVTLGSLINFCDCLMAGGTSRTDHSEVGSGYVHFNFTPWGERGDKATPSLVGDVVRGVFLRERRIFLGGQGGLVGPRSIAYGTVAGAGQVLRRDVKEGKLVVEAPRAVSRKLARGFLDSAAPRRKRNVQYLAQLVALRAWYVDVRRPRAEGVTTDVVEAAVEVLDLALAERHKRLSSFLVERGETVPDLDLSGLPECPLQLGPGGPDHVSWVRALSDEDRARAWTWLQATADEAAERLSA